jgi:hypothetical protein
LFFTIKYFSKSFKCAALFASTSAAAWVGIAHIDDEREIKKIQRETVQRRLRFRKRMGKRDAE